MKCTLNSNLILYQVTSAIKWIQWKLLYYLLNPIEEFTCNAKYKCQCLFHADKWQILHLFFNIVFLSISMLKMVNMKYWLWISVNAMYNSNWCWLQVVFNWKLIIILKRSHESRENTKCVMFGWNNDNVSMKIGWINKILMLEKICEVDAKAIEKKCLCFECLFHFFFVLFCFVFSFYLQHLIIIIHT